MTGGHNKRLSSAGGTMALGFPHQSNLLKVTSMTYSRKTASSYERFASQRFKGTLHHSVAGKLLESLPSSLPMATPKPLDGDIPLVKAFRLIPWWHQTTGGLLTSQSPMI